MNEWFNWNKELIDWLNQLLIDIKDWINEGMIDLNKGLKVWMKYILK